MYQIWGIKLGEYFYLQVCIVYLMLLVIMMLYLNL